MLKTIGNLTFLHYGSEPQDGYNVHAVMRADFISEVGVALIGSITPLEEIEEYEIGVSCRVVVEFHDVDIDIVQRYPEFLSLDSTYEIRLGSRRIGEYKCSLVELV